MRIRTCFVSNSSSSSFISVAANTDYNVDVPNLDEYISDKTLTVSGKLGRKEFGWEMVKSNDFYSKLIFCYLQTISEDSKRKSSMWLRMLENVLKKKFNVKFINWQISDNYNSENFAYIDHQSAACEGQNIEMFENKEALENFLFNPHSFIQTDNDNH